MGSNQSKHQRPRVYMCSVCHYTSGNQMNVRQHVATCSALDEESGGQVVPDSGPRRREGREFCKRTAEQAFEVMDEREKEVTPENKWDVGVMPPEGSMCPIASALHYYLNREEVE